jgi:hypothetical protein
MDRTDAPSKPAETSASPGRNEIEADWYEGVDLAPRMLESLVPWDVSARASREQGRLSSAVYRIPRGIHGGY